MGANYSSLFQPKEVKKCIHIIITGEDLWYQKDMDESSKNKYEKVSIRGFGQGFLIEIVMDMTLKI